VLSCKSTFSADHDATFFQELPATAAVFLLRGDGEPYVSKTANLRRRLLRLLGSPTEHSKRLNLRDRVREIEFTLTGSDFESQFLLYRMLREAFPKTYSARLRLRPAPLVKLHLENEYPRASVTTRLGKIPTMWGHPVPAVQSSEARLLSNTSSASGLALGGEFDMTLGLRPEDSRGPLSPRSNLYYGPFPSRAAAEKFASDALDFFKMRRCVEDLHPDPAFPGCVYSEMKMCLAPCFKGCADADYHAEVVRVQAFFDSAGQSLTRELMEQRESASAELAFEEAAAIHAKLDKLKPVTSQLPEIIRRIDHLQAIIVLPSGELGSVALFHFAGSILYGLLPFNVELRAESQSMESRVEAAIGDFPGAGAHSTTERMEHLALLKRWYYRSHRTGEIFFADDKGAWPLRRIVRGIGRVYRGEKAQEPASFFATPDQSAPS
jgi:excinuclease UvrABC nuclease subunit